MPTQAEKAKVLRNLHRPGDPLLLVNVWDAASARILEELGFPALATTSAGISWREGYADGERISRQRMLDVVKRIAEVVRVPLSADLEAGYGPSAEDAALTADGALRAGAVGLNFEDWDERASALTDVAAQKARIGAIRRTGDEHGVAIVINARTDVFLKNVGEDDSGRLKEATRRGNAYIEAGADCIFVPGVTDERVIEALVRSIGGPLNVLAGPATSPVAKLAELGVARISVGATAMAFVLTQLRQLAIEAKEQGTFGFTGRRLSHAEINRLFER
jgi:2-methylisocitrate lyase-like PEP mutase family enzyme